MDWREIDHKQQEMERDEEYARRVLREVQYIQSEPKPQEEGAEEAEKERGERGERGEGEEPISESVKESSNQNIGWLLLSGNILLLRSLTKHYGKMVMVAALLLLSIIVMFWSLHLDMKYNDMMSDIQLLRERSVRLQEQRFAKSSHSAIIEELERRGIDLKDPTEPATVIERTR